jgi:hypothetical protein
LASVGCGDYIKLLKKASMEIPEAITKEELINDQIKLRPRIDELVKIEEDKKGTWRN